MQKGKYYRMRKELVWGAGILAIASSPVGAVGSGGLLSVRHSKGKPDGIFPAV